MWSERKRSSLLLEGRTNFLSERTRSNCQYGKGKTLAFECKWDQSLETSIQLAWRRELAYKGDRLRFEAEKVKLEKERLEVESIRAELRQQIVLQSNATNASAAASQEVKRVHNKFDSGSGPSGAGIKKILGYFQVGLVVLAAGARRSIQICCAGFVSFAVRALSFLSCLTWSTR